MSEQRTTPETRAALRERYAPEPVPTCKVCGADLVRSEAYSGFDDILIWDCPEAGDLMDKTHGSDWARHQRHLMDGRVNRYKGDPDVIAACDDADALAGALKVNEELMEATRFLCAALVDVRDNLVDYAETKAERLGAARQAYRRAMEALEEYDDDL
jgi:hypothetical protein